MEVRHPVERTALVGGSEVDGGEARQDRAQCLVDRRHLPPVRPRQQLEDGGGAVGFIRHRSQRGDLALGKHRIALGFRPMLDMLAQAGDRREGGEVLDVGQVARKLIGDALDQEVAEADAGEALLAVRDRIEDRGVGALGIVRLVACVEQALHVTRHAVDQRHLDEDQRLLGHARMEEGKAAPIRIEPVLEVAPRADRMDRLVGDELFQQRGRRAPVDAHEVEEGHVEPGAQQRAQVLAQRLGRRIAAAQRQ